MGSSCYQDLTSNDKHNICDPLNVWIKKFKNKKGFVKHRTRGENLRILALLTSATLRAEDDLRQKRHKKALKWVQQRLKLNEEEKKNQEKDNMDRMEEVNSLWSNELMGLDNFMSSLNDVKTVIVR